MHAFNHVVDGALQSIIPMEMLRLLSGICKLCVHVSFIKLHGYITSISSID